MYFAIVVIKLWFGGFTAVFNYSTRFIILDKVIKKTSGHVYGT